MKEVLPTILAAAFFFGGYQLMARGAGQTDTTGAFIIVLSALVPLAFLLGFQGAGSLTFVTLKHLAMAGFLMGLGFLFNIRAITHPQVDVSTAVTCVAALVVLVVTIGGMIFFGESLLARKVAGIVFAIIAIVLLRPGV